MASALGLSLVGILEAWIAHPALHQARDLLVEACVGKNAGAAGAASASGSSGAYGAASASVSSGASGASGSSGASGASGASESQGFELEFDIEWAFSGKMVRHAARATCIHLTNLTDITDINSQSSQQSLPSLLSQVTLSVKDAVQAAVASIDPTSRVAQGDVRVFLGQGGVELTDVMAPAAQLECLLALQKKSAATNQPRAVVAFTSGVLSDLHQKGESLFYYCLLLFGMLVCWYVGCVLL